MKTLLSTEIKNGPRTAMVLVVGICIGLTAGYLGTSCRGSVLVFQKVWTSQTRKPTPEIVDDGGEFEDHFNNHDPVFIYPRPDRVLKVANWETDDEVEFKTFDMSTCQNGDGIRLTKEANGIKRFDALRRCASWPLCQFVACNSTNNCWLRSPSCNLRRNQATNSTVFVISERTANSIPLWYHFKKNLKPLPELRRNRPSASKLVDNTACDYRLPNWGNWEKPASDEYPYIEVTADDKNQMRELVVVDPIHKLVFFRVPKVMSTNLVGMYDRLLGHRDVVLDTNLTMNVHAIPSTHFRSRLNFGRISITQANQVMNDPSWKKIVFFRDPSERFLSFYLDKIINPKGYGKRFGRPEGSITFPEMVSYVKMKGKPPYGNGPMADPHYREQMLLNRIFKFLPHMDFIAWGTTENAELMLKKYGLWEEYGSEELWPFGFMRNGGSHRTGSENKFEKYYNDTLLETIQVSYYMDYEFLHYIGLTDGNSTPKNGLHLKPQNVRCCQIGCFPAGN